MDDAVIGFLIGAVIFGLVGAWLGDMSGRDHVRREAVHRNVGTYDANGKFAWTVER
jgi:uncharacterized protein YcfJ